MQKINIVRLLKPILAISIICCINWYLPDGQANSIPTKTNPVQQVFLDGKINGLDATANCNAPNQKIVGMVPRLSKANSLTEPNPLVSSYTISSLRRCAPNDPSNPNCSLSFLWKPLENNTAYYG